MSEFKREKRYQVTKLSDPNWKGSCVVVEDDWPEYEIVWKMIQDRIEGKPNIIEQLSAANKRIAELLDLVEVVERRNKQLEANLNQVRSTYNQIIAEDTATRNEYLDEIAKLEGDKK